MGNRTLTDARQEQIKISPTEHAFRKYLCVVEDHAIDSETFNVEVLDRDQHKTPIRVDNFIYRLRKKFAGDIELVSEGGGFYKLLNVRETKRRF